MKEKINTPPPAQQNERLFEKYAVSNPKNIITELWERSVNGMTQDDLLWFQASCWELELEMFAEAINASGYALICQKDDESVSSQRIGNLLIGWSDYLSFLLAMACISSDADRRLKPHKGGAS